MLRSIEMDWLSFDWQKKQLAAIRLQLALWRSCLPELPGLEKTSSADARLHQAHLCRRRMVLDKAMIRKRLRAPKAAALAGILFCVLLITSQLLVWISIPPDLGERAKDVTNHSKTISLALNLLPFAGIAFLWFIAVVRNRLGAREDRFFATVFLGSGLLYVAMVFMSAALAGGLIRVLISAPEALTHTGAYALSRAQVYQTMNVYGIKMAGVFMFSTSTILRRSGIAPRWIAFLGYALGAMLLLTVGIIVWVSLVFPAWVFLISVAILFENRSVVVEAGESSELA
jgi:hypothetical protein